MADAIRDGLHLDIDEDEFIAIGQKQDEEATRVMRALAQMGILDAAEVEETLAEHQANVKAFLTAREERKAN